MNPEQPKQSGSRQVKIASIVGARPQFIKAAMVSHSLSLLPDVQEVLVHTDSTTTRC